MDFGIITQGTKLKQIRTKLKLKQEQLSGKEITRNLISMIETDKAQLTTKATKVIIDNLKTHIKVTDKNILGEIENLKVTEKDQAKQILIRFIEYINTVGIVAEKNLSIMLEILNKYELNAEKVMVYYQLGIEFEGKKLYEKSFKYFALAREFAEMTANFGELYGEIILKLLHCCNRLKIYNEGLFILNGINSDMHINQYARIVYNKAVLYKSNGEFEEAINTLDFNQVFSKKLENENLKIKAKLLLANCYREKKSYNIALKLHKKLYSKISNKKDTKEIYVILALENIIETAMIIEDNTYGDYLNNLVDIISKSTEFQNDYTSAEISKFISIAFAKLDNNLKSKEFLIKSLELGKKHKNLEVIDYAITELLNDGITNGEESEVDEIKSEILELLALGHIKTTSKILIKLIEYYIKHDSAKALRITDYCKNKIS